MGSDHFCTNCIPIFHFLAPLTCFHLWSVSLANNSHDHIKQSYVRTKENVMQSTERPNDRENNPVGYAEDAASEYADRIFHKTGHQVRRQAGKIIERKRHRSREKNLLSKKSRPLNGIKEPSRPGEHRNR